VTRRRCISNCFACRINCDPNRRILILTGSLSPFLSIAARFRALRQLTLTTSPVPPFPLPVPLIFPLPLVSIAPGFGLELRLDVLLPLVPKDFSRSGRPMRTILSREGPQPFYLCRWPSWMLERRGGGQLMVRWRSVVWFWR
jgi:hypothetical protein